MTYFRTLALAASACFFAACSEPDTLREEIAEDIAADPEAVVLSPGADDADYLNDERDPEGNRYLEDDENDDATNDQPGYAIPADVVDEDARPDDRFPESSPED